MTEFSGEKTKGGFFCSRLTSVEEDQTCPIRGVKKLSLFFGITLIKLIRTVIVAPPTKNRTPRICGLQGQNWAKTLMRTLGVEIVRHGTLPPEGVLLVVNHRSYIDVGLILKDIPLNFLGKAEVARWPIIGWAATLGATVWVDREDEKSRRASRKIIADRLKHDKVSFVVFPEGTTFAGPGIQPFRMGIFATAAEQGLPVVPVAIEYGNRADAWVGDDSFITHFIRVFGKKKIRVNVYYGPVIRDGDAASLKEAAEQWITTALEGKAP